MTYFQTGPRFYRGKHSDQVSWVLNKNCGFYSIHKVFLRFDLMIYFLTRHDPFSNSSEILSRQTFWPSFMIIWLKMWRLELTQGFCKIWPSDLVFDPTWPIFKLVRDFINKNILTKCHDNWTENVASSAYTRFLSDMTLFLTWPDPFSNSSKISSRKTFWPSFIIIGLKMWPLEHTKAKKLTMYDGHSTITIAHSEHFNLSWAKNKLTS